MLKLMLRSTFSPFANMWYDVLAILPLFAFSALASTFLSNDTTQKREKGEMRYRVRWTFYITKMNSSFPTEIALLAGDSPPTTICRSWNPRT